MVQQPSIDVEQGLKTIAIAFENSNEDSHKPLDDAEKILEARLKQEIKPESQLKVHTHPTATKGLIARLWSKAKSLLQPAKKVDVAVENRAVNVPAEIAPVVF